MTADAIKIQIFGQEELVEHLRKGRPVYSHCISINNPECTCPGDPRCSTPPEIESAFSSILHLEFWDENDIENLASFNNKRMIERDDIEQVLNFVKNENESASGFTLHCWRGISRSASIALGLLQFILRDEHRASDFLIGIRRNAMPLKRAVLLFDEVLGSNLSDYKNTVFRARMKALRNELQSRE